MPDFNQSKPTVAIIGAGMTGVTCARVLTDAGYDVTVYEKSRGLGGRMASRRIGDALTIDHGAQFITARDSGFVELMQGATATGTAAVWTPTRAADEPTPDDEWLIGTPTMNAFLKPMADGLNIHKAAEVAAVTRAGNRWQVAFKDDAQAPEIFDRIISTAPVVQARHLLASEPVIVDVMADVTVAPCWSLLMAFDQRLDVEADVIRNPTPDIALMVRNTSKPGRDQTGDAWVVHASPVWSRENLELEKEEAAERLKAMITAIIGKALPDTHYMAAHRWRYAQTEIPLGQPYLTSDDGTLFVGGDWCLGARVEYAFQSGRAIAEALIG